MLADSALLAALGIGVLTEPWEAAVSVALCLLHIAVALALCVGLSRSVDRERAARAQTAAVNARARVVARTLRAEVIPDLAAAAYALTLEARLNAEDGEVAGVLLGAADETRRSLRQLRAALVEIDPASASDEGLTAVLCALVEPLERRGIAADLELADPLDVAPETATVLFQATREALRNAERGSAERVRVSAGRRDGGAYVDLRDDGRGFDPASSCPETSSLASVRDLLSVVGGSLRVVSEPGCGTQVAIDVPD